MGRGEIATEKSESVKSHRERQNNKKFNIEFTL